MDQRTGVSERVREQGLAQLECDVPAGMTLAEWRAARRVKRATARGWLRRLRAAAR